MTARPRRTVSTALLLGFVLLGAGCGDDGGASPVVVAGTYECGIEGESTDEVWKLSDDHRLVVTVKNSNRKPDEGTWSLKGRQVMISFSGAENDPFDVDGDRLVFAGPAGPDGPWVCTRT